MAQSAKGLLKPFWKHWPAILIYFVVVAAAYWSIETPNVLRIVAVLAIPYGMIVAFLTLFTGDDISVPRMVQFCYAFTIFAALAVALPLVLFPFWPNLDEKMRGAPVGILLGCVQLEGKEKSELNCNETATAQWVINIGGAVGGEYHPSQPAPVAEETPSATLTAGVEETPTTESVEETPTAEGAEGSPTPEQPTPEPTPTREQTQVAEQIPTSKDSAGGEAWRPVEISGGLVVPVYFVLIAVIGAVVSMIRRVPEYQRRAGLGYAEHYAKLPDPRPLSRAPISAAAAREYLVFQIMQVVSAPLIAIVAYQLIDPTELATSVTLAFVSGFASETVLLLIRGATDKLAPAKVAEEPTNLPVEELEQLEVQLNRLANRKTVLEQQRAADGDTEAIKTEAAILHDEAEKLRKKAKELETQGGAKATPEFSKGLSKIERGATAIRDEMKTIVG